MSYYKSWMKMTSKPFFLPSVITTFCGDGGEYVGNNDDEDDYHHNWWDFVTARFPPSWWEFVMVGISL